MALFGENTVKSSIAMVRMLEFNISSVTDTATGRQTFNFSSWNVLIMIMQLHWCS